MNKRFLALALLCLCALLVNRTTASPAPAAEGTPVAYLPFVANNGTDKTPTVTPTQDTGGEPLSVAGPILLRPRWAAIQSVPARPVAYEVLLDVTGSMSYDFRGYGTYNGKDYPCEETGSTPQIDYNVCVGGDSAWRVVEERRIYIVKHKLNALIDQLGAHDTMRIIPFSSNGIQALPAGGWSGDKATLKEAVLQAGVYQADPYLTAGSAPTAQAMRFANKLWATDPPFAAGQSYDRVTLFLTDSVANIFLDGSLNFATDVCPEFNGDARALNTPRCQYDQDGYPASGHGARPISATVNQATILKQNYPDMTIFVMALGNVSPLGLDQVASTPKMLYLAKNAGALETVLGEIEARIAASATNACVPSGGAQWVDQIDAAHTANFASGTNLPPGIYGYAYLTDAQGQPVSMPWTGSGADPRAQQNAVPITQNVPDFAGKLGFEIPKNAKLKPGVYHLQAYVHYKAAAPEGDDASRQYDQLVLNGKPVADVTFTLEPSSAPGGAVVLSPLRLDLNSNVQLCP